MNKPIPQLTRACIVCGLEKPLAAFLQITGTQGTVYGNICSACKGSELREKTNLEDEKNAGGTGFKIDSKAKIQQEINKKQAKKKQTETQHEYTEENKQLNLDKEEQTKEKAKTEKHHRLGFIGNRKKQISSHPLKKQTPSTPFLNPQTQTEKTFLTIQEMIEAKRKEETFEQEIKAILDDPTQLYIDPRFGERKLQSLHFKQTKNLAIMTHFKTMQKLYKQKEQQLQKQSKKSEAPKDPFSDYVEKTSKPTSTRGRK